MAQVSLAARKERGRRERNEMTIKEVKEISKLLPVFIQMCENDLGEAEHEIKKPLTHKEFEKVEKLLNKLNNCTTFVNQNIFN